MKTITLAAALIAGTATAQDSKVESVIGPDYANAPEMAVNPNTEAPLMVVQDGRDYATRVALALDTLIARHRVPAMVAVMIWRGYHQ